MSFSSNSDQSPTNASGEVITTLVLVLFIFFVITLILYIRAKHYAGITGRPRHRLHFPPDPTAPPLPRRRPLDPSILAALPVAVFRCEPKGGADCAVCLSEFAEGEKARFLPECGHGFHAECIDMWFHSNSTCPLCRVQVGADHERSAETSVDVADEASSSCASSSTSGKLATPSNSALAWTSRECDIEQGVRVEESSP